MSLWFSAARRPNRGPDGGAGSRTAGKPGGDDAGSGFAHRRRAVEQITGTPVGDWSLYEEALTHPSYVNELPEGAPPVAHNERLEFLGDAVLGLVVARELYRRFPGSPEGHLSRMRAGLICEETLSRLAGRLGIGELMLLGHGEDLSGGRRRPSLLADAAEALMGALYLDRGLEAAARFIVGSLEEEFQLAARGRLIQDFKTELQERTQVEQGVDPVYRIVGEEGPPHEKVFTAEVAVAGRIMGRGTGGSKREAERAAAGAALERMDGAG